MNTKLPVSTLRDYLIPIFRHKAVILITFITVMICVIIGTLLNTPLYQAKVKMLISAEKRILSPYYTELPGYGQTQVSLTQSEIVTSRPVLERAVNALKLYERPFDYEKNFCSFLKRWLITVRSKKSIPAGLSPDQEYAFRFQAAVEKLKSNLMVNPIRDTDLFTISAFDFDPQSAAFIANVVSRSYIIFDLEQQLAEHQLKYGEKHHVTMQLQDSIDTMNRNITIAPLSYLEAIGPASAKIIEQAQIPFETVGTSKSTTLVLAFFMSIFLGILLAYGFEYMDHTFKSPQDVEAFLNLPVLGSIPRNSSKGKTLLIDTKQTTPATQAYHHLSDQIYLLMKDKHLKSVLITAPSPLEGSTTVVANLCAYMSRESNHKVLVIDANLRDPALHKIFKIPARPGLSDVLEEKITLEEATKELASNLAVLPAGETELNPITLLDSSKMHEIIDSAKKKYEMVVIDYASLNRIKDVSVLSSNLDGIALVVNQDKTRRHTIQSLITPLIQKNSHIIGVVLNNRTYVIPSVLYKRL
ncbi:MAG: polysaccharide biosynthesis tyrosine autokinase [Candidatus Brocadiaceae bacterium]|nr:polysaccharide biosynthesis tyrosine autokinase [Candidatus Brocadiaceae bacterium]